MNNLAGETKCTQVTARFRDMLARRMSEINDTFPPSTWYRDNWIEDRCIVRTATLQPG